MHKIQERLLKLAESNDLSRIPLREIAAMLGNGSMSPGVLQHHFAQLEKKKLLFVDRKTKTQQLGSNVEDERFYTIPIVGMASCGPANSFADESIEGYLSVSKKSIVAIHGQPVAVRASGDSMNNARIPTPNGSTAPLESGDYAIVDTGYTDVDRNLGKYIVSIINGMANIKKLLKRDYDYALVSESTDMSAYPPIVIDESDDYLINGRVVAVVKG
jgi:SOS-response transcriptional repressor LexA